MWLAAHPGGAGREDAHSREAAELQQRCQEAESRHEQLSADLPSATAPLLRQLEAMQKTAQQHAAAWAATEAVLSQRVTDADASAAAAGRGSALSSPGQLEVARWRLLCETAARLAAQRWNALAAAHGWPVLWHRSLLGPALQHTAIFAWVKQSWPQHWHPALTQTASPTCHSYLAPTLKKKKKKKKKGSAFPHRACCGR